MEERDPTALSKDEQAVQTRDSLEKHIPMESENLSDRETISLHEREKTRMLAPQEAGIPAETSVAKRLKTDQSVPSHLFSVTPSELKTPAMATESSATGNSSLQQRESSDDAPVDHIHHDHNSSGSLSSDLSAASAASAEGSERHGTMSPIPTMYSHGVPPAPPSTPATQTSTFSLDMGPATPLPFQSEVLNATQLEKQHLMMEGAATPAPMRTPASGQTTTETTGSKPAALPEDFSEWAVGDRYRMIRILGRGSYGEVAQAVDVYAGRSDAYVAIKRIQSPFDQEVDAIRLYREMHILRRMRGHECIIQLVDVVQPPTDDLDDFHDLYLVFEYVDTDLYKLIMSPQYLTTEHIQTFLYQMLIALKYIHSFSVIHRDIKPANILINEDCSLKICDFGLARIVDSYPVPSASGKAKQDQPSSSETDSIPPSPKLGLTRQLTKHVVTRWYRAPELILIQDYNSSVDMWSLGCILAELLSMQEGNVPGYQDRKPLFPGGTCYPLSGEGDKLKNDERLDQLSVIFNVIGSPSAEDITTTGKASEYIESLGPIQGKSFKELFPTSSPSAVDLLCKMLLFNPANRLTAEEALQHEFFKAIRRPELEVNADGPLRGPDFLESDNVDLKLLKQMVFEEVLWYRDKGAVSQPAAKAVEPEN